MCGGGERESGEKNVGQQAHLACNALLLGALPQRDFAQ